MYARQQKISDLFCLCNYVVVAVISLFTISWLYCHRSFREVPLFVTLQMICLFLYVPFSMAYEVLCI